MNCVFEQFCVVNPRQNSSSVQECRTREVTQFELGLRRQLQNRRPNRRKSYRLLVLLQAALLQGKSLWHSGSTTFFIEKLSTEFQEWEISHIGIPQVIVDPGTRCARF